MRPAEHSEDLRWRMIWQREVTGLQVTKVATNLGVDPSTVSRIVARFRCLGVVHKKRHPFGPTKNANPNTSPSYIEIGRRPSSVGKTLHPVLCMVVVEKIHTGDLSSPELSSLICSSSSSLALEGTPAKMVRSTVALEVAPCSSPLAPVSCRVFSTAPVRSSRIQHRSSEILA